MSVYSYLREEVTRECEDGELEEGESYESWSEGVCLPESVSEGARDLPISEEAADFLYSQAGTEFTGPVEDSYVKVLPQPQIMMSSHEHMILEAKDALGIEFDLEHFQVQALLGLINHQNVIVSTPCGSGKSLIFQMGVILLRKIKGIEHGIGLCLEPLNNILCEKSSDSGFFKSAHLTMTGENLMEGNAVLSCPMDSIMDGSIMCIYGHPESFMSSKGE